MSISQTTPEEPASGYLSCPKCKVALPRRATFCSSCGERLTRKKPAIASDEEDMSNRYRITTLVRRRPYINLYFALDNRQFLPAGQSRMVTIRDVEIAHLKKDARAEAIALAQQEYDQLRSWHIPNLLACINMCIFQGHLFLVSGMPLVSTEAMASGPRSSQRLHTLQDFLQSGQGLPREARALEWIRALCQAVEALHRQGVVLGDLDPYAIALSKNSITAEPKLMISWLRPDLQRLLPPRVAVPQISYFSSPEALQGRTEPRSDVYSLGALLYLLLTGMPPDESTLRHRRRLRTPRETNSRLSQHVDDCVMQALALEPEERFASVTELMAALDNPQFRLAPRRASGLPAPAPDVISSTEAETVRIVPLSQKDVARWRTARDEKQDRDNTAAQSTQIMPVLDALPPALTPLPPTSLGLSSGSKKPTREKMSALPTTPPPDREVPERPAPARPEKTKKERQAPPPAEHSVSSGKLDSVHDAPSAPVADMKSVWKKRITGILPMMKLETSERKNSGKALEKQAPRSRVVPPLPESDGEASLLKQLRQLILGYQQHAVEAAAIIETPLRIRPDQPYNLRLHIMGREEPTIPIGAKKGTQPAGLSALVHGEAIQIEVRSVLQQGYTYVLQHATLTIPASGYAAEITIPMQPQPEGGSGRRDRLHFFFLDERRNPLYEKPFIVEVFVSPLVQFGREGHQVLTIPL